MNPEFSITLWKGHQKHRTFNTVTTNTKPNETKWTIQNQIRNVKYSSVFRTKYSIPHKYKQ